MRRKQQIQTNMDSMNCYFTSNFQAQNYSMTNYDVQLMSANDVAYFIKHGRKKRQKQENPHCTFQSF